VSTHGRGPNWIGQVPLLVHDDDDAALATRARPVLEVQARKDGVTIKGDLEVVRLDPVADAPGLALVRARAK
jgi:hypothetical protein